MLGFFYTCSYKNIYYKRSLIFTKITVGPKQDDYIKKMDKTYCPISYISRITTHCELAWNFSWGRERDLEWDIRCRFCFLGQFKIFYQINLISLYCWRAWVPGTPPHPSTLNNLAMHGVI